jgi:organic radical activating enzyme
LSKYKFSNNPKNKLIIYKKNEEKFYLLDEFGNVKNSFSWIGMIYNNFALAKKNGLFGFLDNNGEIVIPFKYKIAGLFNNNLANVKSESGWKTIDKDDKEVVLTQKRKAVKFNYKIGNIVNCNYGKSDKIEGKITKINPEKQTVTIQLNDGRKIWRRWSMIIKKEN